MVMMILLLAVTLALGTGAVVAVSRLLHAEPVRDPEPELGSEAWRMVNAEVVSVLRAGNRTFLQVRYRTGTSLILNDVLYPAQEVAPLVGQRVPIRYDPGAPARAVYDGRRASGTPPRGTEPRRPVAPRPLSRA